MSQLRSPFAPGFTDTAADDLAATLKAVASPQRLRILALLGAHGQMTGVELGQRLPGLTQPTISHHLRILDATGFTASHRAGPCVARTLVPGRARALAALLDPERQR